MLSRPGTRQGASEAFASAARILAPHRRFHARQNAALWTPRRARLSADSSTTEGGRSSSSAAYRKTAESLPSFCYDAAAGDPLLALWYAIVWTMIERGSLPGSRPLRFKRAPARVVDARNENHDRDADVERGELLRSLQPA
jgi:hypothetical protein